MAYGLPKCEEGVFPRSHSWAFTDFGGYYNENLAENMRAVPTFTPSGTGATLVRTGWPGRPDASGEVRNRVVIGMLIGGQIAEGNSSQQALSIRRELVMPVA